MPGFDGTGPYGDGRPGRGLGPCGRLGRIIRYGFGRGRRFMGGNRGRFRGYGGDYTGEYYYEEPGYGQPPTKEDLQSHKKQLEKELKWIDEELNESEGK